MSVATPTLIPRSGHFPHLLPPIPSQGEPKPPASRGRSNGRLNTHRDLVREMEDLSDEENDLEALETEIRKRGFAWLVPIGRMFTQQEEKNDAEEEEDDDDDDDDDSAADGSDDEDEDEEDEEEDPDPDESAQDLDARLEDMDDNDASVETEEMEDEEDEYDE